MTAGLLWRQSLLLRLEVAGPQLRVESMEEVGGRRSSSREAVGVVVHGAARHALTIVRTSVAVRVTGRCSAAEADGAGSGWGTE